MPKDYFRQIVLMFICALALFAGSGCDRSPAGTSDNLKADYDRVVKERDDLKADFDKRKAEIESLWQQRMTDRDQRIAGLTTENAGLRQRLLVADAAGQDLPLVDSAHTRSVMWLHGIYLMIIAACLVLIVALLWVHLNLRERVRVFVMEQAKFVPTKEVFNAK